MIRYQMLQEANRNGGKELRNSRPGLVSRFREVSGDLLVHLRQERLLIRERERVSTWCTSFVSSCAAFSASLSKKSELAFGDGAILYIIFRVFS